MNRYIILVSTALCLLAVILAGCGTKNKESVSKKEAVMNTQTGDAGTLEGNLKTITGAAEGRELTASVQSEEEAKDIADKYGIEFVDFSYGVAVFHTDEDPVAVINRGKKNGWPVLSINGQGVAFGGSEQLDELDADVH